MTRSLVTAHTPDYCKIDVEGWEVEVLKGLHQAVAIISLEYHVSPSETPRAIEALRRLATLGCLLLQPPRGHEQRLSRLYAATFSSRHPLPVESFAGAFPHHPGRG